MKNLQKNIIAILLATMWISVSEFVRNEFILKSYWLEHYKNLGIEFPQAPINGAVWGIWSLCFAIVIFINSKKYNYLITSLYSWFIAFVMMWLVIGNLSVLPLDILIYAIPLSLLESFLASLIIMKMTDQMK